MHDAKLAGIRECENENLSLLLLVHTPSKQDKSFSHRLSKLIEISHFSHVTQRTKNEVRSGDVLHV